MFVYGTLKRGFHNHRLLTESRATFVATAKTRAPMRLVLGEYGIPYLMKEGDAAGRVPGELWEVDDAETMTAAAIEEGFRLIDGAFQPLESQLLVREAKTAQIGSHLRWRLVQ